MATYGVTSVRVAYMSRLKREEKTALARTVSLDECPRSKVKARRTCVVEKDKAYSDASKPVSIMDLFIYF